MGLIRCQQSAQGIESAERVRLKSWNEQTGFAMDYDVPVAVKILGYYRQSGNPGLQEGQTERFLNIV